MKIPFKYVINNFRTRKLTTGITIAGIALVVFVFSAVLMMAYGVQKTLIATGSPDNVKISRKSSSGEISSIIDPDVQNIIRTLPGIAKNQKGEPLYSAEPVVVINLNRKAGGLSNVMVRGISPATTEMRPQIKIVEGRMLRFGVRELIVGSSISKRFNDAQIGSSIKFGGSDWQIVGRFETGGSGFDSEIMGDALQILNSFNRGSTVSTITVKLSDVSQFDSFAKNFTFDKRLNQFEAKIEQKYYEEQSEFMAIFIRVLGIFVTIIFSMGSIIGAMITMYAAVANRTVEVGTLRAIGFKRRSILGAFLIESLTISIIGGVIGILLASTLSFFSISTLNFASFSELEFSFALSPDIVISSIIFALLMGFAGGFLPSVRAARMNIVNALRAG